MFANVLEPHQKVRIEVLLGMKDDPSGAGYNVNQSKIAIGSGGILGKGGYRLYILYGGRGARLYWLVCRTDFVSDIDFAFDSSG